MCIIDVTQPPGRVGDAYRLLSGVLACYGAGRSGTNTSYANSSTSRPGTGQSQSRVPFAPPTPQPARLLSRTARRSFVATRRLSFGLGVDTGSGNTLQDILAAAGGSINRISQDNVIFK